MPLLPPPLLRDATRADLPAIDAMYDHYVCTSTCTLQLEPAPPEERQAWFEAQLAAKLPVLIAERDGAPVGWGALGKFQPRPGYRFTLEDSIYVHPDCRSEGVGRALLGELLRRAPLLGAHSVIAKISGDQPKSLKLHAEFGFVEVGRLTEVGFKFDRWLDVVLLQRRFDAAAPAGRP